MGKTQGKNGGKTWRKTAKVGEVGWDPTLIHFFWLNQVESC
jgi:hypothetical protein